MSEPHKMIEKEFSWEEFVAYMAKLGFGAELYHYEGGQFVDTRITIKW